MRLRKRNPDKSDFCYFPFFEVLLTADGKYKPCSKHEEFISHEGKILEASEDSVEKAWNSDYMKGLRESFLNGERRKGCRECWREQEMGLRPMRYDSYEYGVPEKQVKKPDQPLRVEINASNVCNLRCRICMPTASHKWIKEARELYGWHEDVHFNMNEANLEKIKSWAPNLIEIGLFGGEPLMAKENIALLRYCVEQGFSKNINVLLNTNGTVYTDEIVSLFKQFKHVFLNFSIDDIGKRFEYQRKDANWDRVVENMKKYISHGGYTAEDVIECKVCCSVTNMNIYYFPEYFEFMNKNFPGLPVYWNLIYEPWEYSIEILPPQVKDLIRNRLENFVHTTYEMDKKRTKTVEDLITYLNNSIGKDFNGFFEKIERHDRFRQESFQETFPEFWKVIKPYQRQNEQNNAETSDELPDSARLENVVAAQNAGEVKGSNYRQAFQIMMEQFEEWESLKPKIDELENLVGRYESDNEAIYKRLCNESPTDIISYCRNRSSNELFESYKLELK